MTFKRTFESGLWRGDGWRDPKVLADRRLWLRIHERDKQFLADKYDRWEQVTAINRLAGLDENGQIDWRNPLVHN